MAQNFTVEEFLKTIPEKDPKGNEIPPWKRHMLAKKAAEKAKKEAEEAIRKEFEDRKSRSIPEWKRQLLKKECSIDSSMYNQQNNGNYIRYLEFFPFII